MSFFRAALVVLCAGFTLPSLGQSPMHKEIAALERLPEHARINFKGRIDALLARAVPASPEELDLLYLLASERASKVDHKGLLATEERWAGMSRSSDPKIRAAVAAASAMAWRRYYLANGQPSAADDEVLRFDAQALQELPEKWRYRVLAAQADAHEQVNDLQAATEARNAAHGVAALMKDTGRMAWSLAQLAWVKSKTGALAEARTVAIEAYRLATQSPDEGDLHLEFLNMLGLVTGPLDLAGSRNHFLKMAELAKAHGEPFFEALALANLADSYLQERNFEPALAFASRAHAIRLPATQDAWSLPLHNVGIAKIGLGRLAEGKQDVLLAITRELSQGNLQAASDNWRELGQFLERAGDKDAARLATTEASRLDEQVRRASEVHRNRRLNRSMGVGDDPADPASAASQARRHALVIGNQAYPDAPLTNPLNDARAMAKLLTEQGFLVSLVEDLRRDDIGSVVDRYLSSIRPGDDALFFYAGHGVQVRGVNYLPAVDARMRSEGDAALNSINLNLLAERLDEQQAGARILLIDACRDNPFGTSWRPQFRGLGRMPAMPAGTLAHFATRPGAVASDGAGLHGLYTGELLRVLSTRSEPVELLLKEVSAAVRRASKGEQEPWSEGSIEQDFVLARPRSAKQAGAR